ncbi:MAG: DNA repair protein RecN [Bacteroidales bacterium]
MLKSLTVSNYALIENLEIGFPEGLVIITGETGAGKSILMGAISLLLGSKADLSILKDKNKNCVVEAVFEIAEDPDSRRIFDENSLEFATLLTLRRVISPTGKSRSFANDEPVNLQFLKDLSEKIIDIHAQHQHLLLSDSNFQLSVLDSFANNGALIAQYQECFGELSQHIVLRNELKAKIIKEEAEAEYNSFQLNQLEEAKLIVGELEEIEEEYRLLSNAEAIRGSIYNIVELLSPTGTSVVQNLKEAVNISGRISHNFKAIEPIAERIESCRIELKDIEQDLIIRADSITVQPERVKILEDRISAIYSLLKKHHTESVESLIAIKNQLNERLLLTNSYQEELEKVEREISGFKIQRDELAGRLHSRRVEISGKFINEMISVVRELEMPHAIFEVKVKESESYNNFGKDSVTFFFSANKNIATRELSKVASGGELSRIMLCLKVLMAKGKGMPSMIFDEIDSGVSGSIADKMGNLIDTLSKKMQIFAITHLPQIASKGKTHLLVYKDLDRNGVTRTNIREISAQDRVRELARMLSGSELTSAAVANARELLGDKF